MRTVVAYAPALFLLALGLLALAVVPPIRHPIPCHCPVADPVHPSPCLCPTGSSVDLLGLGVFLIAVVAAGTYTIGIRVVRRRRLRGA